MNSMDEPGKGILSYSRYQLQSLNHALPEQVALNALTMLSERIVSASHFGCNNFSMRLECAPERIFDDAMRRLKCAQSAL